MLGGPLGVNKVVYGFSKRIEAVQIMEDVQNNEVTAPFIRRLR
jgi:hypothetical protein